jgi:hypothetical protein
MLGGESRDARRTERYLDGLMAAEERGAPGAPQDLDLDPAIRVAARELRAGLVRVHPSFRFEEGLAARLAQATGPAGGDAAPAGHSPISMFRARRAGGPVTGRSTTTRSTAARSPVARGTGMRDGEAPLAVPRRLSMSARPSRPFVVGGVGVASAAISIGAVYVAWRWSHGSHAPMVRAVRAARSGRAVAPRHGRRAGVLHGIFGVMS